MTAKEACDFQIENQSNWALQLIKHLIKKNDLSDSSFYAKGLVWQNPDTYIWRGLAHKFRELGYTVEFFEDSSTIDSEYAPASGPVTRISW
jgi:hypothetical protein